MRGPSTLVPGRSSEASSAVFSGNVVIKWNVLNNFVRCVPLHPHFYMTYTATSKTVSTVPTASPSDVIPHTLHARHRQFSDPFQLEQYVTFREPHRVRYTNEAGVVTLDQLIEVKYEFSTVESSLRFQGDLRRKDLVDCFDVDVVWTDTQGRTDSFGNVRGIGAVQRLKMWTDQYSSAHSLTIFANRAEGRYREYFVDHFEGEVRNRDDRRRTLRLVTQGRRGGAHEGRRISLSSAFRSRQRSSHGASSSGANADIRYLGIQFSRNEGEIQDPGASDGFAWSTADRP